MKTEYVPHEVPEPFRDLAYAVAVQAIEDYKELVEMILQNPESQCGQYIALYYQARDDYRKAKDEKQKYDASKRKRLYGALAEATKELLDIRRFLISSDLTDWMDFDGRTLLDNLDRQFKDFDLGRFVATHEEVTHAELLKRYKLSRRKKKDA